ncbi:hypothetical protein [Microbulbifer epialgicus]|uniref:Uncharacterized protein n=1 Tax=Microbulbifer epialgicus TaxID=393907 RepID=A0ABV4P5F7_9GAMM
MITIDREPERDSLLASAIVERIDVSRPVMTCKLKSMVIDKLITMEADSGDSRAKCVALAKGGKQFLQQMLPEDFRIISNFTEGLK